MNDQQANALFEQSIRLLQENKAQEALKLLTKLDQALPSNPGILYFTATGHSFTGNKHKAIQIYERVLRLNPQFIEAYNNIALDLAYIGEHQNAIAYLDRALAIRPDFIEAIVNKGCCLNAMGQYWSARQSFEDALRINPKDTAALANLSVTLRHLGEYGMAKSCAETLLQFNPRDHKGHSTLGKISSKLENHQAALSHFLNALNCNPNDADTLSDIGATYSDLGNFDLAHQYFKKALLINPEHGATHLGLGTMYHDLRDFNQALKYFNAPIQDKYRLTAREYNRSLSHLHAGNFHNAWVDYAWRWKESGLPVPYLQTNHPLWEGQTTNDPILIWHEQGIGDQILFGTLLHQAAEKATNLIVRLDRRLVPIFQRSLPHVRFIADDAPITEGDFKFHLPLADLGRLFRPEVQSFEHQPVAYLQSDITKSKNLRTLIQVGSPIIGLAWVTKGQRSNERNLPIDQIVSIIQSTSPTAFVDLQYSDTTEDRARILKTQGVEIRRIDEVDNFNHLDSLAALISACDYVVTCSNSTAHFAGALGKATFLLVPFGRGRHWYWSNIREDGHSMWYPSVHMLPQSSPGDWSPPLKQLSKLLGLVMPPDPT